MSLRTFCQRNGFDAAELRTAGTGLDGIVVIESFFNDGQLVDRDDLKELNEHAMVLCKAAKAISGQLYWQTAPPSSPSPSSSPSSSSSSSQHNNEIKTSACIHVPSDNTYLVMYAFDRKDPMDGLAAAATVAATAVLRGTSPTALRHRQFADVSPVASGMYTVDISTSGNDAPTPAAKAALSLRTDTVDVDFEFPGATEDDGDSSNDDETTMAVFGDKDADVARRGKKAPKKVPKLALPQLIHGCDVQAALTARSRRPDFMTTMCIMEMLDMARVRVGPNSQVFKATYREKPVIIKSVHPAKQEDETVLDEFAFEGALMYRLWVGAARWLCIRVYHRARHSPPTSSSSAEALCRVDHPNICFALGCGGDPLPFLVLEQLQPLTKFLNMKGERDAPFPLERVLSMARDLASGLHYLHELMFDDAMVIHRDIKLENVGLDETGRLKLFDFGLGRCVKKRTSENQVYKMTGETGTLRYMAPEIALNQAYTEKVDVYSFAITVWSMASNLVAFKHVKQDQFHGAVAVGGLRPPMDPTWPGMFKDLLELCWHADSTRRPTCAAILMSLQRMMPRPPPSEPRSSAGHNLRRPSRPQMQPQTQSFDKAHAPEPAPSLMHVSTSTKHASFTLPPIATGANTPSLAGSRWTSAKY